MNRRMKCFVLGVFLGLATGSYILYTNTGRGLGIVSEDLRTRAWRKLGRVEGQARCITNGTRTLRLVRFSG